jgi:hypothetical protein
MVDEACPRPLGRDGHPQGRQWQAGAQMIAHRPAAHFGDGERRFHSMVSACSFDGEQAFHAILSGRFDRHG